MASDTPAPFPAARYAALLVGPFAFVCLATKAHKLIAAPEGGLGSTLAALFADVLFLVVFGLVTWVLLRYLRRTGRAAMRLVLHLLVLLLTVFVFVEHGFWVTTGTLLDPYTLGYGLEHIGPLGKVYLSEMGLGVWLGFAVILGVQLLPLLATRKRRAPPPAPGAADDAAATAPSATVERSPLWALAALAVAPACTGFAALAAEVPSQVEPLTDNVVVTFAADIFAAGEAVAAPASGEPEERLVEIGTGPAALKDKPGNVIVIIMESLRARSTTVYDAALDTSPFLASLAKQGAVVDVAWPAVTHTSKAIVGVLCGIYPKLDVPIEEAEPTGLPTPCLARLMGQRGYDTAFMQTATAHFERRDQLVKNMDYQTFESKETLPTAGFEETSYFGYEDRALVKPALDWIGQRKKPFFLTLLTLSTHHTYKTPSNFPKVKRASGDLDEYLNAVSYLDQTLAELFTGLDALGVRDDTLIVLVGDHGEGFGEHGRQQHDSVIYEEGLHIPLMLVGPGVPQGQRIGGLRHAVDIMPTVLEWLGTPVMGGLPGKSLLTSDGHERIFASCWLRQRCIATREGGLKYIWHFDKQSPELFDLRTDPYEKVNLLPKTAEATWRPMNESLLGWKTAEDATWAGFFARAARDFVTTLPPLPQRPLDILYTDAAGREMVRLIGVDAPTEVRSGDPVKITLYWEVLSPPGAQWKPFTHLLGTSPGARPRYNADHVPVAGRHPVAQWQAKTFIADPFRIQPDKVLPVGSYELVVGLWDETSKAEKHLSRAVVTGAAVPIDDERRAHVLTLQVR